MRRQGLSNLFKPGDCVTYDGFHQYPELLGGDVYVIDEVLVDEEMVKLHEFPEGKYDSYLFSEYYSGDSFQHFITTASKEEVDETHWSIPEIGEDYILRLRRLNCLRSEESLKDIDISEIQWYQNEKYGVTGETLHCPCCDGKRVLYAELQYPVIVLDGTTTSTGCRYLAIDGSHRIQKLLYYGNKTARCYVFHIDEVRNYFVKLLKEH
jgi:hypothetical protein